MKKLFSAFLALSFLGFLIIGSQAMAQTYGNSSNTTDSSSANTNNTSNMSNDNTTLMNTNGTNNAGIPSTGYDGSISTDPGSEGTPGIPMTGAYSPTLLALLVLAGITAVVGFGLVKKQA